MTAVKKVRVLHATPCSLACNSNYCPPGCAFSIYIVRRQILDTYLCSWYSGRMNYYHPPIYYTIRSIIRWTFWSGVVFVLIIIFGKFVSLFDGEPDTPCPAILNIDFTWSPAVDSIDLKSCRHPNNVILKEDGTWEWEQ